jgi:hypothetical protein
MNRVMLAMGVIGLLLTSRAAHSSGLYGTSGLFLHPTAYLPPDGHPTLGSTYFSQTPGSAPALGAPRERKLVDWVPVFLDKRLSERVEGGLVFLYLHGLGKTRRSYGAFAKYQLMGEQPDRPALAFAIDYLGSGLRIASAYLVASKQFGSGTHPIRGHLGYVLTHRSDLHEDPNLQESPGVPAPDTPERVTASAPFVGLEVVLAPTVRLVGEVEQKRAYYVRAPMSVGLMWNPAQNVGLGVGWVNTGRSEKARFFVGVGYKIAIRR